MKGQQNQTSDRKHNKINPGILSHSIGETANGDLVCGGIGACVPVYLFVPWTGESIEKNINRPSNLISGRIFVRTASAGRHNNF